MERPWSVSKKGRNQQRLANSKRKARWFEQRRLQNDREVRLDAIEDLRIAFGASLETLDSDDDDRKLRDFASFLEDLRNDLSLIQTKANSTSGGEMKALMAEEKQLRRKLTEITGIVAVLAAAKRAKEAAAANKVATELRQLVEAAHAEAAASAALAAAHAADKAKASVDEAARVETRRVRVVKERRVAKKRRA